jgi:hypothetical protein
MNKLSLKLSFLAARSDVRVLILLATVAMFILSAGAPDASGGVGMSIVIPGSSF